MQMGKSILVGLGDKQVSKRGTRILAHPFEEFGNIRQDCHAQIPILVGVLGRPPTIARSALIPELGRVQIPYPILGSDSEGPEPVAMRQCALVNSSRRPEAASMIEAVFTLPAPYRQIQIMRLAVRSLRVIDIWLALQFHNDRRQAVARGLTSVDQALEPDSVTMSSNLLSHRCHLCR